MDVSKIVDEAHAWVENVIANFLGDESKQQTLAAVAPAADTAAERDAAQSAEQQAATTSGKASKLGATGVEKAIVLNDDGAIDSSKKKKNTIESPQPRRLRAFDEARRSAAQRKGRRSGSRSRSPARNSHRGQQSKVRRGRVGAGSGGGDHLTEVYMQQLIDRVIEQMITDERARIRQIWYDLDMPQSERERFWMMRSKAMDEESLASHVRERKRLEPLHGAKEKKNERNRGKMREIRRTIEEHAKELDLAQQTIEGWIPKVAEVHQFDDEQVAVLEKIEAKLREDRDNKRRIEKMRQSMSTIAKDLDMETEELQSMLPQVGALAHTKDAVAQHASKLEALKHDHENKKRIDSIRQRMGTDAGAAETATSSLGYTDEAVVRYEELLRSLEHARENKSKADVLKEAVDGLAEELDLSEEDLRARVPDLFAREYSDEMVQAIAQELDQMRLENENRKRIDNLRAAPQLKRRQSMSGFFGLSLGDYIDKFSGLSWSSYALAEMPQGRTYTDEGVSIFERASSVVKRIAESKMLCDDYARDWLKMWNSVEQVMAHARALTLEQRTAISADELAEQRSRIDFLSRRLRSIGDEMRLAPMEKKALLRSLENEDRRSRSGASSAEGEGEAVSPDVVKELSAMYQVARKALHQRLRVRLDCNVLIALAEFLKRAEAVAQKKEDASELRAHLRLVDDIAQLQLELLEHSIAMEVEEEDRDGMFPDDNPDPAALAAMGTDELGSLVSDFRDAVARGAEKETLRKLIEAEREKLRKLWDVMRVTDDVRYGFSLAQDNSRSAISPESLDSHRMEVERLEKIYRTMATIVELIHQKESYARECEQLLDAKESGEIQALPVKEQHKKFKRLDFVRSGLLSNEKKLRQAIAEYEQKYKKDFIWEEEVLRDALDREKEMESVRRIERRNSLAKRKSSSGGGMAEMAQQALLDLHKSPKGSPKGEGIGSPRKPKSAKWGKLQGGLASRAGAFAAVAKRGAAPKS